MKSPKVAIPNVRLKQERLSRGWSQADVADKIGSDAKTVGRWERGVTSPSPYLCQQLCKLYGKTVQELALVREEKTQIPDIMLNFENEETATPDPTLNSEGEKVPVLTASAQVTAQQGPQRAGGGTKRWRPGKRWLLLLTLILLVGVGLSALLLPLKGSSAQKVTLSPANPYGGRGSIALNETLKTNTALGWSLSNNDEGQCFFADGAYRVRGIKPGGYMKLCVANETYFTNFTYEVRMQVVAGDCGGLAFRTTFPQLYYFVICQDGKYRFVRYDRDSLQNRRIVVSGVSSAIHHGLNSINVLGVVADGESFTLYVNDVLMYRGTDGAYLDGQIGLMVHTCSIVYLDKRPDVCAVPVEAVFSNARVWKM